MMRFSSSGKWWVGVLVLVMLVVAVAGCTANANKSDKPIFMRLFGFNYTNRYIALVSVDGNYLGGLDAYLNGGSSSMSRRKFTGEPVTVQVRWVEADGYDMEKGVYISDGNWVERSANVQIGNFHQKDATTLVLHFLPVGVVEAELVMRNADKWSVRRTPVPKEHSYHVRGY